MLGGFPGALTCFALLSSGRKYGRQNSAALKNNAGLVILRVDLPLLVLLADSHPFSLSLLRFHSQTTHRGAFTAKARTVRRVYIAQCAEQCQVGVSG